MLPTTGTEGLSSHDTSLAQSSSLALSNRPSPVTGLTTFPNPFADEPEPGLLPSFLSKVKNTFVSPSPVQTSFTTSSKAEKGIVAPAVQGPSGEVAQKQSSESVGQGQTEAQAIAEAARTRTHVRKQSSSTGRDVVPIPSITPAQPSNEAGPSRPPPTPAMQNSAGSQARNLNLKPPMIHNHSASSSTSNSTSTAPSSAPSKRLLVPPGERQWRPAGAAPAQVTISPVTSVTTTVQATTTTAGPSSGLIMTPPQPQRAALRAHFGLRSAISHRPSSSHSLYPHNPAVRLRRSSIATIPDSPSSVSLSAMIAANAELSQNPSYVPGFPLAQDDTRSVRSLGFVKKSNSVSRLIRRMRGEGLSKHYWMADEHCKECYDCKSIFTAWRRKHHCRICGQIFCSRCASNIIGARRFGQEGAVRVCNLCLKIMEEYKDDVDDDDRRSINSVTTSVRLPSISDRVFLDAAMSPEMPYAKSPFAASQLFTSNPNESLTAIDESSVPTRWRNSVELERPFTPVEGEMGDSESDDDHIWTMRPNTAAPFRRPMYDDSKEDSNQAQQTTLPGTASGAPVRTPTTDPPSPASQMLDIPERPPSRADPVVDTRPARRVEFPRTDTISTDGGVDGRVPLSRVDSDPPLIGLRTRLSSRASQGGLTALLDSEKNEGLWRARSHSFAHRPELLAGASLHHFHVMLQQAIERAGLPDPGEWGRVLGKLLLKVSTSLHPNVRAGDSIDVRAYVKIKKVPGGKINDSEYVDGIVISKNVAHKAMPRRLVNPRIMVVTFPLDYHRVENQFMSLDPILAQEKDYLRLLTRRIVDVRPHIVLVERSASRIALEYLLDAGIAVARSVKLSAIHQVARCTQADVVASMDRLALEPRLGRCAEFQIQSFEHELIPGRRKSLMRFEGCQREYGCTIILRGGDLTILRKVKVVTDFMVLVACHLKNEIILYNDEHNILPPHPALPQEYQTLLDTMLNEEAEGREEARRKASELCELDEAGTLATPTAEDEDRRVERSDGLRRRKEIAQSLKPYLNIALSASAAIRFPPPAPLAKMAELDRKLSELRQNRDEAEAAQILQEETKPVEPTKMPVIPVEVGSAPVPIPAIVEHNDNGTSEISSSTAMSSVPSPSVLAKDVARDPYRVLRKPEEISHESALAQVEHDHAEQLKLWQWYTRRHVTQLRPEDFQGIVYLYSLSAEGNEKPCVEPNLQAINFYQPDDHTLGQFLEGLTADAGKPCVNKSCERLLLFHFRLLVHGERRLQIAMDQFPCPSPGHEDQIITWSYCRLCATPSPTTILREETWKMSWGAYLEHCFYPPERSAGFACPHDAYRDQIRYFAHRNLAIRIHNERIDLYDPLRPSITLQVKPETKVLLKNQEYESALHKNAAFFDSILFRLRSFDYEIVQPEKVPLLKPALETMLARAVADREEMVNLLNRTYKLTPMTDVLALNTVLRTFQDKVVQWDSDFIDVEKTFMPSEKDLRRMTATHLKRLFANQDVFNSLDRNVAGLTVSEADEKDIKCPDGEEEVSTEPPTPTADNPQSQMAEKKPAMETVGETMDDEAMPMTGITSPVKDSINQPLPGIPRQRDYDSDSTISAVKRSPLRSLRLGDAVESSGMDSDVHGFVSRLPRKSRPTPSVADMVKRFHQGTPEYPAETQEDTQHGPPAEQSRPSSSSRRSLHRSTDKDGSDSDIGPKNRPLKARPPLRRGRTEQPPIRHREISKLGLLSDGDRSYAANASRIPSNPTRRPLGGVTDSHRPSKSRPVIAPSSPPRSGHTSPMPGSSRQMSGIASDAKSRTGAKGKMPRQTDVSAGRVSPGPVRTTVRRTMPGSSRVTSIARHFDRLSREAERERQKRISMVRGKRARPVGETKATVQVFDNVRDAFKDESDSDSSEADNEEDDQGSDDSADSNGPPGARRTSTSPRKAKKSTSPVKSGRPPVGIPMQPGTSSEVSASPAMESIPISASASSVTTPSIFSDAKSEMSFTDRLQIELPSFETSAPLPSVPATPQLSVDTADEGRKEVSQLSQMSESELSSGGERSSILKTLTGLWVLRAGDYTPLEYPLSAAEHLFTDSRVIIRENEPTSIIAFTLSSKTYRDKMRNNRFHQTIKSGKVETFMPDESSSTDRSSTWDILSLDEAVETDDPSKREGGTHLKYEFESGASTIFCRIFFAERFSALRAACECEDSFVESLSRCVQFDASGGKSGSAFLKTKDERFIAKEISRLEMDALTKFAPSYFEYTRNAIQGQRPTVLAKIYGFFKIGYRNAITGRAMRMNVLIMENLFYERRFSKIYDLKGSVRNRLIQPTGRVNEVLLDENLMELVYKHPLYLREHSKRILRSALFNDTLFLSNLNVMDYSLVVGVDSDRHELVVGIVDYIRTFTWDKKLESWVKDSTFLGGAGKGEPTIVTPKQYKTRFRTAMERFYFPSVPDRWSKIGADDAQTEEEANGQAA